MPEPTPPIRVTTNARDWSHVHLWQIQPIRDGLVIAAVVGLIYLGDKLSVVTVPLLLALALAYLFEPLVAKVTRRRWMGRPGAALTIIVVSALAIVLPITIGGWVGIAQGAKLVQDTATKSQLLFVSLENPDDEVARERLRGAWRRIRDYVNEHPEVREFFVPTPEVQPAPAPNGSTTIPPVTGPAPAVEPPAPTSAVTTVPNAATSPPANNKPAEATSQLLRDALASVNIASMSRRLFAAGGDVAQTILNFFKAVGQFLFGAFLTGFFFYFFCTGYGRVLIFWENLIPERKKGRVFYLLNQMDSVIAGFIRGRLTVAAILIIVYTLGYWLVGVPAPLIVGPIMGLLTIIPYAASIAAPIAMILMWLNPVDGWQGEWWWIVGGPLLILVITQFLDDWILSPMIQGKSTNMDVPTILFASIAGGALAGVYGLLLAIPVAACIKILMREVFWPRFRAWSQGRAADPLPIRGD